MPRAPRSSLTVNYGRTRRIVDLALLSARSTRRRLGLGLCTEGMRTSCSMCNGM